MWTIFFLLLVGVFELISPVSVGGVGGIGIAVFFVSGVEALVFVGGLEVSLQVDPRLVRAGFIVSTLARIPEAASLVLKVVDHA